MALGHSFVYSIKKDHKSQLELYIFGGLIILKIVCNFFLIAQDIGAKFCGKFFFYFLTAIFEFGIHILIRIKVAMHS